MPNGKEASAARPTEAGGKQAKVEVAPRVKDYVLVRHMARNPRTRTMRAARAGHRRQGVLLDDGTRIRKKGRKRFTEVALTTLADNHQKLLEYIRVGSLEACDPATERPLSYQDVLALIQKSGASRQGFKLDDSGVQQGAVDGADKLENAAPPPAVKKEPKAAESPPPPKRKPTESELHSMKLDELKVVAVNTYGMSANAVGSMRAKREVISAILAQGKE